MTIKNFELYLAAKPTASECGTVEYVPSADTDYTTWTASTGASLYGCIDEYRASRNTSDYIYVADNPGTATDTVRVTLPGTCNVSTIRVYMWCQGIGSIINIAVDISNDNVTYTAAQDFAAPTTAAEVYKDYTSLGWTTPAYCYVRFKPNSSSYNNVIIYSMEVVTNP